MRLDTPICIHVAFPVCFHAAMDACSPLLCLFGSHAMWCLAWLPWRPPSLLLPGRSFTAHGGPASHSGRSDYARIVEVARTVIVVIIITFSSLWGPHRP
jgi:hypothetical protein